MKSPLGSLRRLLKKHKRVRMLLVVFGLLVVAVAVATYLSTDRFSQFGSSPAGARLERMKQSPNWGGARFDNPVATHMAMKEGSFWRMMRRWLFGKEQRVPRGPIPVVELDPGSFDAPPTDGLRLTWLGHSTVLVEIDGWRVLTDPVWAERCSPSRLVGPARFFRPPISLAQLPPLDAVVISHDHYDHLDKDAVVALAKTGVHFYMPLGVGAHLEGWGIAAAQIIELDWWERAKLGDAELELVATPARHFSGRGIRFGSNVTQWASWVFVGPQHRVYFSGDTGPLAGFAEIGEKLGPFDVTFIKIGAYGEDWPDIHVNPEQAVEAHQALGGRVLLPVHWGTFNLAYHAWTEPPERLLAAASKSGVTLVVPRPGEMITVARPPMLEPWWREVD